MKKLFVVPFAAAVLLATSWCKAEEIPFTLTALYDCPWQPNPIYTATTDVSSAVS